MPASRRRGVHDPDYLNYTLGKLMIMKLRTDWLALRAGKGVVGSSAGAGL
jgi:hypothetical protein